MDPIDLRLFLHTASSGNMSVAAREVGLSPSLASKRLSALERRLGATLLRRTTRRVSVTEAGSIFEEHAKRLLSDIEAAEAAIGHGARAPRGLLRITIPASFGHRHVSPALPEFLRTYPELELDLALSETLVDVVGEGFDCAIRIAALEDSTLVARKLAPNRRLLCAAPAYLERHGVPQHPDDLAAHNCIRFKAMPTWTLTSPRGDITVHPRGNVRTDNGEVVRDCILSGLGIALKSTWDVHEDLACGRLAVVLSDFPVKSRTDIWAVYPGGRFLPPKVRAFIDFFAARFGPEPYWDKPLASCKRV